MTTYEAMIHCLKSEINGSVVRFDQHLSESELDHLYEISKYHDLSHMVGSALIKNKVLQPQTELYNKFQKKIMLALRKRLKTEFLLLQAGQAHLEAPF